MRTIVSWMMSCLEIFIGFGVFEIPIDRSWNEIEQKLSELDLILCPGMLFGHTLIELKWVVDCSLIDLGHCGTHTGG